MEKGYLVVSDIHSIYYERCGLESAFPILFVHGGPGAGFTAHDKRFFDFSTQQVIFFDQRGASKSKPFGEIRDNTTEDLSNDMIKLLDHLDVTKVILMGGSWGTALSLYFAIHNPERVESLILRAVFLGDKLSISHFIEGGVQSRFPKQWVRFRRPIPKGYKGGIAAFYLSKMLEGTQEEKDHFCYEWAFYEISIFMEGLEEKKVDEIVHSYAYKSLSIMEAYYLSNGCFLPDNYIINNADQLKGVPCRIIHGSEDAICPVESAKQLHRHLQNSKIFVENAGHSDRSPSIELRIKEVLDELLSLANNRV